MGGQSKEREVSLSSGQAVMKACSSVGFNSTEIVFDKDYKALIGIMKEQDIIFNALHGGVGENGKIQTWMNNNKIKYTGSEPYSSALCMNKSKSKEIAKENGVPLVEDKPLARTLNKTVEVGQMIPASLYKAVAEILAYVYKLKHSF